MAQECHSFWEQRHGRCHVKLRRRARFSCYAHAIVNFPFSISISFHLFLNVLWRVDGAEDCLRAKPSIMNI